MNVILIALGFVSTKSFSGGNTTISHLAKGLMRRGARLTFITSKAGEKLLKEAGIEGDFWLIDQREEASTGLPAVTINMLIRMLKTCILLARKKLDQGTVVYAVSELLHDELPLLFVRGKGTKRLSFFCMPFPSPLKGYKGAFTGRRLPDPRATIAYMQQWFSFFCLRHFSDCILTVANLSDFLVSHGISLEKIVKFLPGVERDVMDRVTPEGKKYDACWIGRYHPMKGLEDLIEAWGQVCQIHGEAKLVLMGGGTEKLEPLIKENQLEGKVYLTGLVSEETKFKVMKESKIFVFPSYYESWNRAICEAMACGLPAVAYDLPVYKEAFPKGMVIVPVGNKHALAKGIIDILTDSEKREELSCQAKEVASWYDPDQLAQSFVEAVTRIEARQRGD